MVKRRGKTMNMDILKVFLGAFLAPNPEEKKILPENTIVTKSTEVETGKTRFWTRRVFKG